LMEGSRGNRVAATGSNRIATTAHRELSACEL
jgi:hypothetical protein